MKKSGRSLENPAVVVGYNLNSDSEFALTLKCLFNPHGPFCRGEIHLRELAQVVFSTFENQNKLTGRVSKSPYLSELGQPCNVM